jgi:uncharacterized protein GlcG (DUF336 family)
VVRAGCRALIAVAVALAGCAGGRGPAEDPAAIGAGAAPCSGLCADATTRLLVGDVERVIAQAVAEADAQGSPATIAVVDRVGNVLAVFAMTDAPATVTIGSGAGPGGLEGVNIVPATLAAIAKAVTAAYLSTEGNAFSTRTASQIVQSHFNPGERLAPGGPLFGVQFSQLPCGDLAGRFAGASADAGPKRSPLGLAADPGGFPLYVAGTPVGGVGVVTDGAYGLDADVLDRDRDADELVALAGTYGFAAPADRRADRITADGKTLRFSDVAFTSLDTDPAGAPSFLSVDGVLGSLVAVPGYALAVVTAGTAFGTADSGIRADTLDFPGLDAFVLVDDVGVERFRPTAGGDGPEALSAVEVQSLLAESLAVANATRAQIRTPLGTPARVTISVVDSAGRILGIARTRDAPVFGIDVSLQKARSAAFLSSAAAATALTAVPEAEYLDGGLVLLGTASPGDAVPALRDFLDRPTALADGAIAFSTRAVGNLARPFYPDGVDGSGPGPLGVATPAFSPFHTGLQLDLVYNGLIRHVAFVLGLTSDAPANCTGLSGFDSGLAVVARIDGLANGLQIFPGGVPVYRGSQLVGAVGVSGDGVDQDDLIAFLGVDRAGAALGTLGNAPTTLRADQLEPQGARLRYVNCPQAPFLGSNVQEACSGL